MFNTVLVANRGEIAVRVIRGCRELGIRTVAVYSEPDATSPFVRLADESVPLGGAKLSETYLDMRKILDAAAKTRAEAIHPGYGLLSENAAFPEACAQEGIVFIGPPSAAMRAMGGKAPSRELVKGLGLPTIPGSDGIVPRVEEALTIAGRLGYPVLLKASAGGGGIGMKVARDKDELQSAFETTQRLALAAFGDGRLIVEKLLEDPRHVEIQVASDGHGRTIHLFERECTVQRRFQKLLEETPSMALTEDLREEMGNAAVRIAQAAGYANLGTLEFIVSRGRFYFLEMNTRLQVEHPITEATTGLDLVHMQLQIAAAEAHLPAQGEIDRRGHAIECRINAEDPAKNFMPSPGTISKWIEPGGPHVRVDAGVAAGQTVSFLYDPLLAKLIVWAGSRHLAIRRMSRALSEFQVEGVKTTIPFHRALLENATFQSGQYTTAIAPQIKLG
ncbi:MAG: acetyl-CoA carboxylase biotin carboxylase subunit [Methanobacteriota archaeon]|nr:MAG: acetyl-CoA carboxylase biotin carboxylase subunit [Euryarchaeota archaeon]